MVSQGVAGVWPARASPVHASTVFETATKCIEKIFEQNRKWQQLSSACSTDFGSECSNGPCGGQGRRCAPAAPAFTQPSLQDQSVFVISSPQI